MRNIRRLDRHRDVCDQLAKATHPRTGNSIFPTYRELACFAALLAFEQGKVVKLDGPSDVLVDGRIFGRSDQAEDVAYLLGLAATRSAEILREDDEQPEKLALLFEEYVAGGLEILQGWIRDEPSDAYGDRAVLTALRRGGYLEDDQSADEAIDLVTF